MEENSNIVSFLVFIAIALILIYFVSKHLKGKPNESIVMINGDVGVGKTSYGVYLSRTTNNKKLKMAKFKNKIRKLFKKKEIERPTLYCNMPLFNTYYKEFTMEHLLREARFEYNSNIYLNEASMIADSMLAFNMGKDEARKWVNDQLKVFCKLIRHETKGKGITLVLDTQNPKDLALAGDRVLSQTNYILKAIGWIPFVRFIKVRKIIVNVEEIKNNFNEDVDNDTTKWVMIPKSIFKCYNSHCFEFLTRNKPIIGDLKYTKITRKNKYLMEEPFKIVTLNRYKEIMESNRKLDGVSDSIDILYQMYAQKYSENEKKELQKLKEKLDKQRKELEEEWKEKQDLQKN